MNIFQIHNVNFLLIHGQHCFQYTLTFFMVNNRTLFYIVCIFFKLPLSFLEMQEYFFRMTHTFFWYKPSFYIKQTFILILYTHFTKRNSHIGFLKCENIFHCHEHFSQKLSAFLLVAIGFFMLRYHFFQIHV